MNEPIGKRIPDAMRVKIIQPNFKAATAFGLGWGADVIKLTPKMLKVLHDGKCIAVDDGEYSHFILKTEPAVDNTED